MRLTLLTFALAACGGASTTQPPPPPPIAHFDADAVAQGPTLSVTVDPEARSGTISARDMGLVFGVAFHLVTDPHLPIDSIEPTDAFGADAVRLHVASTATARFGLTRPGPSSAPIDLTAPRELARFTFHPEAPVDLRPRLERLSVRRLDGSFVAVTVTSGRLVIP